MYLAPSYLGQSQKLIANELMDQKVRTYAERQTENKRKLDNNNQAQQQPPNKQSMAIAYTAGSGERKEYAGTIPLCNKCKFHHNGLCTVKCANCKRVGHLTRDCRNPVNNQRILMNMRIKGTTEVIAQS
ncbi:reverse transcriptase domain-containing protein [Tanacetum coccineum]